MQKKKGLLLIVIVFAMLLAAAGVLYKSLSAKAAPEPVVVTETEEEAVIAPDFTAYDADGNAVTLSEHFGKPIVLNFWASWCGPCKSEMPAFMDAYEEYGEDITFLMVNLTDGGRETVGTAKDYLEKNGYTFPVLFDTEYAGSIAYRVTGIPATYFINADGTIYSQVNNALSEEALNLAIELLLRRNK